MTGDTGKIRHRERASQQIDFSGLRYKFNATPSNLDGVLELDDHLFVLLEYKHVDAQPMPKGQRLLIERMTDALWANGRYSVAVIGQHAHPTHEDIDAANAAAIEIRWRGEWKDMKTKNFTVKHCVDRAHHIAFVEPF